MKRFIIFLLLIFVLTGCKSSISEDAPVAKTKLKMQMYWGLPVGIAEAMSPLLIDNLKKYNIEAIIKTDIKGKNVDFSDVVNNQVLILGDLMSMIALKDSDDWRLVGRLSDYRIGVLVPNDSNISSFKELSGKRIAGNVAAVKFVKTRFEQNGLPADTPYTFVPMEDDSIRKIILGGDRKNWELCDAVIVPDGLLAYFEAKGLGRIIDQDKMVLPIIARNSFIQQNPEFMVDFFRAFSESLESFRKNMISEKKYSVEGMPEDLAAEINRKTYQEEENFDEQALKPLRFYFNKEEIDSLQATADMVFDFPITKPRINIVDYIDVSYAEKALERKPAQ